MLFFAKLMMKNSEWIPAEVTIYWGLTIVKLSIKTSESEGRASCDEEENILLNYILLIHQSHLKLHLTRLGHSRSKNTWGFTDNQGHRASRGAGRRRSPRWCAGGRTCTAISAGTLLFSWTQCTSGTMSFPSMSQDQEGRLSSRSSLFFLLLLQFEAPSFNCQFR